MSRKKGQAYTAEQKTNLFMLFLQKMMKIMRL